jgi:hypothetical protein
MANPVGKKEAATQATFVEYSGLGSSTRCGMRLLSLIGFEKAAPQ